MVSNTCADYIALCQAIAKVGKGGRISFFSGVTKNEYMETNLLNLLHYKEAVISGVYGMTRAHMEKAVPFMQSHKSLLALLIEKIVAPEKAVKLMPDVLSGRHLKHILDFSLRSGRLIEPKKEKKILPAVRLNDLPETDVCRENH